MQKRLLLMNLKELYAEFKKLNPDNKVGFSKFASLRPKQCVLAGSSGTHSVCVCVIHQNFKLMCECVFQKELDQNKYNDFHTWVNLAICKIPRTECYLAECSTCPGLDTIRETLENYFDRYGIETVQYNMWTTTDRSEFVTKIDEIDEFIENFLEKLPKLVKHSFITKQQNIYFNNTKQDLKADEFLVVLDFAENYTFVIQDEVQSYHWTNTQATIHPFGVYYKEEDQIKFTSCIIISDILKHNTIVVQLFLKKFINYIKSAVKTPQKIFYFSDGSASQYKNKSNMYCLTCHENNFNIKAEWNFFVPPMGRMCAMVLAEL